MSEQPFTRAQMQDVIWMAEERGAEKMLLALGVHSAGPGVFITDTHMLEVPRVVARRDDVRRSWEVLIGRKLCPEDMDDDRCLICGANHDAPASSGGDPR